VNICTYCGRENDAQATHCWECGTEVAIAASPAPVLPVAVSEPEPAPLPAPAFSERSLQIAEVVIVCSVAFGAATFFSLAIFGGFASGVSSFHGNSQAVYTLVHEGAALALLWWVLARRRESLISWFVPMRGVDIGHAITLIVGSCAAYYISYYLLFEMGLAHGKAEQFYKVTHQLFGPRIAAGQLAVAFFNPFFEELIVRAYLITMVKQLTGSMQKAVLTSVLVQTSYHLYQGGAGAVSLSLMFLIYSIYYARTGRIQAPLLAHMYQDVSAVGWAMMSS
jgi:membrane protease YdiL (CAAX protease family)